MCSPVNSLTDSSETQGRALGVIIYRCGCWNQKWVDLFSKGIPQVALGERNGNPLQCSYRENPVARGACWAAVHGVAHDWSNLACTHALEKEMATHSSILAWRIPGTEEPGGLLSMWLHRVRYDWSNLAAAAAGSTSGKESTCQCRRLKRHRFDPWVGKIPWRRVPQATPVSLPGGLQSTDMTKLDMTEAT